MRETRTLSIPPVSARGAARSGVLRPLGPRGEGWVGIQTAIALVVLGVAPFDPLAWRGAGREVVSTIGMALCLAGIGLFAIGARTLGASFSVWVAPRPDARLVTDGPYRWTRHPVCTAQAVFAFGWALLATSPMALVLAVAYAAYLDRGKLRREEETLLERYPEYRAYTTRVTHRMWPVPPRSSEAGLGNPGR